MEAKFIVGDPVDICYTENMYHNRWYHAGWIRDLEDLPGIDEIKATLTPASVEDMSSDDGKLLALPYYTGFMTFAYNELLLEQAGLEPPTTWEEVLEQCRKLKADGLSERPMVFRWGPTWVEVPWQFYGACYSEGEWLWDDDFNPTFEDGGVAFKKVLELWNTMWAEELVIEDAFARFNFVEANVNGRHCFSLAHDYFLKICNDAEGPAAGHIKLTPQLPGAKGTALAWDSMYVMGAKTPDPLRAWEMMKFFGGKNKEGEYYVVQQWMEAFGAGNPYPELVERPEVAEFWNQYVDYDTYLKQKANARMRKVVKALWYPEWENYLTPQVQECILGNQTVDQTIENLATQAKQLKAEMGG
jgi:multiple sugar transport system substrate-binding protein